MAEKARRLDRGHSRRADELVARRKQLTVTLTTAYELSEAEAKDIVGRIEQASGRRVEAVRGRPGPYWRHAQAGSLRADASVRGRLDRLALELGSRG